MSDQLVKVKNSIELPGVPLSSALHKILANALEDLSLPKRRDSDPEHPYWEASFFHLTQAPLFLQLSMEQQQEVLQSCSRGLIEEAAFIEKSATCFTSKMTLLSERTEERMLYSIFAAEEVGHYAAILSYLPESRLPETATPFITLLNKVLEEGDKTVLTFIIQVVLEGWGLTHFSGLAESCTTNDLRETFRWFVRHEARHHGSGVLLFNETPPTTAQEDHIIEIMSNFLCMIQTGPQAVLGTLYKVHGGLSLSQLTTTCEALDSFYSTAARLSKLKALMRGQYTSRIISKLEEYKAFTPYSSLECARAFTQWRE